MNISKLQKYILLNSLGGKRTKPAKFEKFYPRDKTKLRKKTVNKIITRSLERMLFKGLIICYGEKTQYKFFISEVKLTPSGAKLAKKLLGEQQRLPLK